MSWSWYNIYWHGIRILFLSCSIFILVPWKFAMQCSYYYLTGVFVHSEISHLSTPLQISLLLTAILFFLPLDLTSAGMSTASSTARPKITPRPSRPTNRRYASTRGIYKYCVIWGCYRYKCGIYMGSEIRDYGF